MEGEQHGGGRPATAVKMTGEAQCFMMKLLGQDFDRSHPQQVQSEESNASGFMRRTSPEVPLGVRSPTCKNEDGHIDEQDEK